MTSDVISGSNIQKSSSQTPSRVYPWLDKNTVDIVQYNEVYSKLLTDNLVKLIETIHLPDLWPHLLEMHVVDRTRKARIQSEGIERDQAEALLDFLQKNPTWKLHGFFKALCDSGQEHIISNVLALNPKDYQVEGTMHGGQSTSIQPDKDLQWHTEVSQGIADHKEVYHKTLMQGHLYDIEELDKPYDMANCYIQIIATSDEYLVEPKDIVPDKAMSADPGKPPLKTAVLQGPPGAGKSSFIRNYAYKWSKPVDGDETEEQKMWDFVVVLHVSTLRLSEEKSKREQILEAIRQSIKGPEIEAIVGYLENRKIDAKVLLIPDGLDECRSHTTLEMLKYLVEQSHINAIPYSVFATCRSGLCPIKQSEFERRMKIEGFTVDQGIEYVENYYCKIQKPEDSSIFQYIADSKGKLDHILTNPLRTHILSVVTADGTLKLKKGEKLGLNELLSAMEESTKRRQIEKGEKSKADYLLELGDIEDQTRKFYMISLYTLLEDLRTFDDSLLQRFDIKNVNPYFAFMRRIQTYNKKFQKVMEWHFTHEMWHEYIASCGIQALPEETFQYFLLHLCLRTEYRNTQRILFSALGEDDKHLGTLSDLVKGILLLQTLPDAVKGQVDLKKRVQSLKQGRYPLNLLLPEGKQELEKETALTTISLWDDIRSHFTGSAKNSEKYSIFTDILFSVGFVAHVYSCLHEVAQEREQMIFDSTLGYLLPCSGHNRTFDVTGGTRLSVIEEYSTQICIYSWSPVDALQLVQQYGQPHHPEWTKEHDDSHQEGTLGPHGHVDHEGADVDAAVALIEDIYLSIPSTVKGTSYSDFYECWGPPPPHHLCSSEAWSEMLGKMSRRWEIKAEWLALCWDESCPISVKGLLDALLLEDTQHYLKQLLVEQEGGWRDVTVENGTDSSDLCTWVGRYTQQRAVRVELLTLTCSLNMDNDSDGEKASVRAMESTVHGGEDLFCELKIKSRQQS